MSNEPTTSAADRVRIAFTAQGSTVADAAAEYARTMSAALEGLTARLDALAGLAGRPGDITVTDLRDDSDDIAADLGEVLTAAEVFADVLAGGAR